MAAQSYGERVRKDSEVINEVMRAAEMAEKEKPEIVKISRDENGYDVIRIKNDEPGVHERKAHMPGRCLEPEL